MARSISKKKKKGKPDIVFGVVDARENRMTARRFDAQCDMNCALVLLKRGEGEGWARDSSDIKLEETIMRMTVPAMALVARESQLRAIVRFADVFWTV